LPLILVMNWTNDLHIPATGASKWLSLFYMLLLLVKVSSLSNNNNAPKRPTIFIALTDRLSAATPSLRSPFKPRPPKDPTALWQELNIQASTEPRLAHVARPLQIPALVSASVATLIRGASGVFGCNYQVGIVPRNASLYTYFAYRNWQLSETMWEQRLPTQQALILYEYESDADCRLVREACSILSLTVTMYPIPLHGKHYRARLRPRDFGATGSPPFLFDPNTQIRLDNTVRIIDYLFATYGSGVVPWTLRQEISPNRDNNIDDHKYQNQPIHLREAVSRVPPVWNWPRLTAELGVTVARFGAGGQAQDSTWNHVQNAPMILYMYEGSPFAKLVRERLSALELPHTIYYTPRGSRNRQQLYEQTGRFQVPFLRDVNTGVELFESEAILEYLDKQYAITRPTVEWM
jgi:Glutathione S-transferase, N-terminal domain